MSQYITDVLDDSFSIEVEAVNLPVLIDFWAPWCAPCIAMTPIIEDVAKLYAGRVKVVKIDIDQAAALKERFGVRSIPTLVLFKDGQIIERAQAQSKTRLCAMLDRHTG